MDGETVAWVLGGGGVVGSGVAGFYLKEIIAAVRGLWSQGRAQARESRRDSIEEWQELLNRAKSEIESLRHNYQTDIQGERARYNQLLSQFSRLEKRYERAIAWIEYISSTLEGVSGFKFHAFRERDPDDDSGEHRPLQQTDNVNEGM